MLETDNGSLCQTPEEAMQQWIQFFADMEGGTRQSTERLREDWITALSTDDQPQFAVSATSLPTLVDLELAYRKVACGKATGPDRIPGELCHAAPAACARATFASLWKLVLFGHKALCYKGGLLFQAYKGKGPTTRCSSDRSLLISNHIGKSIHRAMRCTQASIFEKFMQAQQLGVDGLCPSPTACIWWEHFNDKPDTMASPAALIMLDLKEAFYRIFRPLCMECEVTDQSIALLMHRLQMPKDALKVLRGIMKKPCALQQAGMGGMVAEEKPEASEQRTHRHISRCSNKAMWSKRRTDLTGRALCSYHFQLCLGDCTPQAAALHATARSSERISTPQLPDPLCDGGAASGPQWPFVGPTWMDDLCVCMKAKPLQLEFARQAWPRASSWSSAQTSTAWHPIYNATRPRSSFRSGDTSPGSTRRTFMDLQQPGNFRLSTNTVRSRYLWHRDIATLEASFIMLQTSKLRYAGAWR